MTEVHAMNKYDSLKLENQLCFPLYAASKEIVRRYKPALDKLDLTYTQYITMMVMWEHEEVSVKEIGELLYLDSGTLTPVLKTLEKKGYIKRTRSKEDERELVVKTTAAGENLKDDALAVPKSMTACVKLDPKEAKTLYSILYKLLGKQQQ